ncbi:MAG: gliding motility-associated C-terminal domain-containing protein [Bacteroidia bacterium]
MKHTFTSLKKVLAIFSVVMIAFLSSSLLNKATATHVVGSDMSYSCTSTPGVYQVTLKVYRDCQGIPLCSCPLSSGCSKSVTIQGAAAPCNGTSFGSQTLTVVPNVSGFDIIQLCAMSTTICTNCATRTAGSFTPGIEVYTFQGTINLSSLPTSCCMVRLIYQECCRNNAITTLVNPGSITFFTEAIINRCATPCNSSPTFTNDPVAVACAGQDFSYNLGAVDPDGDSLSYAFGQVLNAGGVPASYLSPYSASVPFPYLGAPGQSPPLVPPAGIFMDPVTGDLQFRPLGFFVSNLVIEVRQWRNINGVPTLMGMTRRDLQFYSINCPPNNPPIIRTYTGDGVLTSPQPNFSYSICAGQQLCIIITAWDNTASWDTTDLTWNAPPDLVSNGATFTRLYNNAQRPLFGPRLDSFRFCWTPPASMARNLPYYFVVTAKDRACPLPARATRSFSVLVRQIPLATINKVNKNCGFYDFTYTQTNNVPINPTYTQWQIETGPRNNNYQPINGPNVINHRFTQSGWHRVRLRLTTPPPPNPNGCPNDNIIDSVWIPELVKVTARDTFNCFGAPVRVQAKGGGGIPVGLGYNYEFYSGGLNSTNLIRIKGPDSNITVTPSSIGNFTPYKVKIFDLNNCTDSFAFQVFTRPLPLKELFPTVRVCAGQDTLLDAGNSNTTVANWRWYKSPAIPALLDTVSQQIVPRDSGRYVVRKIDNFGCIRWDTTNVFVNPLPPIWAGPDVINCQGDPPVTLRAQGINGLIDSFQWHRVPVLDPTTELLSNRDTVSVQPSVTTDYRVRAATTWQGVTCVNFDTARVIVYARPILTNPAPIPICRNNTQLALPLIPTASNNGKQIVNGVWSYPPKPSAVSGSILRLDSLVWLPPATASNPYGNVIYRTITDNEGCVVRDSLMIAIFPVPIVNAGPSRTFCDNGPEFNISGGQGYTPNGGVLGLNELWVGNGVYKPVPSQNRYAFNPRASNVKLLPDTNILTYFFTVNFPPTTPVLFNPAISGITISSPPGGCPASDTIVYGVIKSPILKAGIAPPVCKSSDTVNFDAHMIGRSNNAANPALSYWYFGPFDNMYSPALTQGRKFLPRHPVIPDFTRQYQIIYADNQTGCFVADTTTIQVNANPVVDIDYLDPLDSAVCQNKGSVTFYMNPNNVSPTDGQLFSMPPLPTAFNVTAGTMDLTAPGVTNQVYNVKYYYKDPATGCDNRDSIDIRVQIPPQLDITDDGDVCEYGAQFTVGFKTAPQPPYGVGWNTPDGDGTIINNGPLGIVYSATQNDINRGRITFRAFTTNNGVCPGLADSATYIIKPKPLASIGIAPDRGCVDRRKGITLDPILTAINPGVANSTFRWYQNDPGFSAPINSNFPADSIYQHSIADPGTYDISLIVEANGCTDTAASQIFAYPTPVASFYSDPEQTTIARPNFNFFNTSTISDNSPLSYIWQFGTGTTPEISTEMNPANVRFPADTARRPIWLTAISQHGCVDSTMRYIRIDPDITVFIPSVFYPGSQLNCPHGCNRTFKVAATGFETLEIFVFNRWGQMVYKTFMTKQTYNPEEGWNGYPFNKTEEKMCQQDAYIYQVNATSFSGKKYTYSGSVTLLW